MLQSVKAQGRGLQRQMGEDLPAPGSSGQVGRIRKPIAMRVMLMEACSGCSWKAGEMCRNHAELGRGGHGKFCGGDGAGLHFEETFIYSFINAYLQA